LNVAQQTATVTMSGALLPTGIVATQGADLLSAKMTDTANTLVGTNAITGTTLLNSVFLENTGATLFSTNDVISFGAKKGGGVHWISKR